MSRPTESTVHVDLDSLEPDRFEPFATDLLAAVLGATGHFNPRGGRHGESDEGYDGSYLGPFRGTEGTWRVSVKRVKSSGDVVKRLQDNLKRELKRHAKIACLVVTNARLTESQSRRLERWLAGRVPQAGLIDGHELERLVRLHPWVGRTWGLLPGNVVFSSPQIGLKPTPLLQVQEDALSALMDRIREGDQVLWLTGVLGSGRERVLEQLAQRWVTDPAHPPLQVVHLSAPFADALVEGLREELYLDRHAYLFLVPPLPERQLQPVLDRLTEYLPGHVLVVASTEYEAVNLTPRARWRGAVVGTVHLPLPTERDLADWLFGQGRGAFDRLLDLSVQVGSNPRLADLLLDKGFGAAEGSIQRSLELDDADYEALVRLVLLLPISPGEGGLESVAEWTERPPRQLERVLDKVAERGLLNRGEYGWDDVSPVHSAALIHTRAGLDARLIGDLSSLEGDKFVRAARRLTRLTGDDARLLGWVDQTRAQLDGLAPYQLASTLDSLAGVGSLTPAVAGRVMRAVQRVVDLLQDPSWPVTDHDWWRERGPWWVARSAAGTAVSTRHVADHSLDATKALLALKATGHLDRENEVEQRLEDLVGPLLPGASTRLQTVLQALMEAREAGQDTAALIHAVTSVWLSRGVPWRVSHGPSVTFGYRAWNEHNDRVVEARRHAVDTLLQLTRSSQGGERITGWKGLGSIGANNASSVELAPAFVELRLEIVEEVTRRMPEVEDWDERVEVEHVVLGFLHDSRLSRAALATAIHTFHREPAYQAWRLMAAPDRLIVRPEQLAHAVEGGSSWEDLYYGFLANRFEDADKRSEVAERLAQESWAPGRVVDLLVRVDARRRAGGWGQPHVLAMWMDASPDLFEPILLGRDWSQVPQTLQSFVLWAAARTRFAEELRSRLEGPVVSRRDLGVLTRLQHMMNDPARVEGRIVAQLLPTLIHLVAGRNVGAVLYRLASHPDPEARRAVAREVFHWIHRDDPPANDSDLRAVVEQLTQGEPGLDATWWLADECDGVKHEALLDAVTTAVGRQVAAGRAPERHGSGESGVRSLLDRLMSKDPGAWVDLLSAHVSNGGSAVVLFSSGTPAGAVEAAERLVERIEAEEGEDRLTTQRQVLRRLGEVVPLHDLAIALLDSGQLGRATIAVSAARATPQKDYFEVVARVLERLDGDHRKALLSDILSRSTSGVIQVRDEPPARFLELAEGFRAVDASPSTRQTLDELAGSIEALAKRYTRASQDRG